MHTHAHTQHRVRIPWECALCHWVVFVAHCPMWRMQGACQDFSGAAFLPWANSHTTCSKVPYEVQLLAQPRGKHHCA